MKRKYGDIKKTWDGKSDENTFQSILKIMRLFLFIHLILQSDNIFIVILELKN
jgi:hypothetical protein